MLKKILFISLISISNIQYASAQPAPDELEKKKVDLGKVLFLDVRLSGSQQQSCASCHSPEHGFADPKGRAVSEGARRGMFTSRNAPSLSYAAYVPARKLDRKEDVYIGGLFHDGRSNSLESQVDGPLLNPLEMDNRSREELVERLVKSGYLSRFREIYGNDALRDAKSGYRQLAELLAAYERSPEVSPFSSKYDLYLAGKVQLTVQEKRGLRLFEDEKKGNCAACHPSTIDNGKPPLFTDFTYDNLGVPANARNPYYSMARKHNPFGHSYVDLGLGAILKDKSRNGKFRVPTLRNIAKTAPYMHNGVFTTLEEVVDFYNTRDSDKKWARPEVSENVNKDELGNLKLNRQEVEDLVAFLKTLTDGYTAKP